MYDQVEDNDSVIDDETNKFTNDIEIGKSCKNSEIEIPTPVTPELSSSKLIKRKLEIKTTELGTPITN